MRLVGIGLMLMGGLVVWRLTRAPGTLDDGRAAGWTRLSGRRPYRAGPWPGLSPTGGLMLLGCALLLAGGQLVLGDPRAPFPDMPLLGILALLPMALATRLVRAPGVASGVCGAYLLPRTVLSLFDPGIQPPPLLLVPAVLFDLSAWLRASDFAALNGATAGLTAHVTDLLTRVSGQLSRVTGQGSRVSGRLVRVTAGVMPRVTAPSYAGGRRRGLVGPRRCGRVRGLVAGAIFGGVLVQIEPAFAVLLGANPATWSASGVLLATLTTSLGCAIVGLFAASGRDTEA